MDVESAVKSVILALAFLAATVDAIGQGVQVFGVSIDVRDNCDIVVDRKEKQSETLKAAFSSTEKCRILPNSETTIPRIELFKASTYY